MYKPGLLPGPFLRLAILCSSHVGGPQCDTFLVRLCQGVTTPQGMDIAPTGNRNRAPLAVGDGQSRPLESKWVSRPLAIETGQRAHSLAIGDVAVSPPGRSQPIGGDGVIVSRSGYFQRPRGDEFSHPGIGSSSGPTFPSWELSVWLTGREESGHAASTW